MLENLKNFRKFKKSLENFTKFLKKNLRNYY